jgi:hypothetical protein
VNSSALPCFVLPTMMCCLTRGPKQYDQPIMGWYISKCETKINIFSLQIVSGNCYSNGHWLTQEKKSAE